MLKRVTLIAVFLMIVSCSPKKESQSHAPEKPVEQVLINRQAIPVKIPKGHKYFTVVIDDTGGKRVRNLLQMGTAEAHAGKPQSDGSTIVAVAWDGTDDQGNSVPEGKYTVRGLTTPDVEALYEYTLYNPGNPPWEGYKNSGWAADHGDVVALACLQDSPTNAWQAVLGCSISEGGDYMLAVGDNDQKVWGLRAGWGAVLCLGAADGALYYNPVGTKKLHKIGFGDAKVIGFTRPAGRVPHMTLENDLEQIAVGKTSFVVTEVPHNDQIQRRVLFFDKESGRTNAPSTTLPSKAYLAYNPNDQLFASLTNGLVKLDAAGAWQPVSLPSVSIPGPLTFDRAGNLYIVDWGVDYQVKVFDSSLNPLRTIGTKGGQKPPAYDRNAFSKTLHAIALDSHGNLWTSEGPMPRRQAVWDVSGKLIKEFIGTTFYGAMDCKLHNQNSKKASVLRMILDVDPEQLASYKITQYLTAPPKAGTEKYNVESGVSWANFPQSRLFTSSISGKPHEYYLNISPNFPALLVKKNGEYKMVAAVFQKLPAPHLVPFSRPSDPDGTLYVWSDANGDELIQESEIVALPDASGGVGGWCYNLHPSLTFYAGNYAIEPTSFTDEGEPIYTREGITKLSLEAPFNKSTIQRAGKHLYGLSLHGDYQTGTHFWTDLSGKLVATFPASGPLVHPSMKIPMPPRGTPVGELFVSGIVDEVGELGSVMAIHGNYGQVYFFTEDGLFITDLFRDVRDNPEGMGEKVERGKNWRNVTMNQESFGGWFGRQDDGKFRYAFGRNALHVVEIRGLESARRFDGGEIIITSHDEVKN